MLKDSINSSIDVHSFINKKIPSETLETDVNDVQITDKVLSISIETLNKPTKLNLDLQKNESALNEKHILKVKNEFITDQDNISLPVLNNNEKRQNKSSSFKNKTPTIKIKRQNSIPNN